MLVLVTMRCHVATVRCEAPGNARIMIGKDSFLETIADLSSRHQQRHNEEYLHPLFGQNSAGL